jgi:hypothetical protein
VTFVVEEDPDTKRPAVEMSVPLHPNSLELADPDLQPNAVPVAPNPAGPAAPFAPTAPGQPERLPGNATGKPANPISR